MREGSLTMLTQRKLSNVLGSAIEGIDLSRELADAEFCVLARALWEGGVLAIKGQRLAPGQQEQRRGDEHHVEQRLEQRHRRAQRKYEGLRVLR